MKVKYITPDMDMIVLKGKDVIITSDDDLPVVPNPPQEQALLDDYGVE